MRYIKRFNESKKELQELINGSLSYLLDDPTIIVKIGQVLGEDQYLVTLTKSSEDAKMDIMEWSDIKDSFIPLLQILSNDYDFIITTGTMVAYPFYLLTIIFNKKFIFIETFGRANMATVAGKKMEKHSDLFIVQWETQKKHYKKAIYGGCLY